MNENPYGNGEHPGEAWIRPDTEANYQQTYANPPQRQGAPADVRRRPSWAALIGTSLASALLASGATFGGAALLNDSTEPTPAASTSQSSSAAPTAAALAASSSEQPNWEAVAAHVKPSVVAISTRTAEGSAAGSGVILDSSGHILTNNHVIDGARQIQVSLSDGRMFEAEVRGTDPATDLAVITLTNPPSDLEPATFGDSSGLTVGQPVVAVGNPLGLSSTVTTGIVSALNRPVTTQQTTGQGPFQQVTGRVTTNAIQLDASVNPGNSGGPVFDATGQVIGITSSIATLGTEGESGSIGLGFAIPGDLASRVADQLIADGVAKHAFLGVGLADGEAKTKDAVRTGALVRTVESDSPAAAAGIESGDVIVAI